MSRASANNDLEISNGIDSCTCHIYILSLINADKETKIGTQDALDVTYTLDGKSVTLIDTPGFDDSSRTEVDILKLVSTHLMKKYEARTLLSGIVFLQPIALARVQNSEVARTRLIKKLVGDDAYKHLVIVPTMWTDREEAERLAQARVDKFTIWGDMVDQGAKIMLHDNSPDSATNIIRHILTHGGPVQLLVQKELAKNPRLEETTVGRQLNEDMGLDAAKLRAEMEDLRREVGIDAAAKAAELRELQVRLDEKEEEIMDLKRGC